jgi:hypothetical protein
VKQAFITKSFRQSALAMLATVDAIVREYQQQGYTLTLRQLYYQLVARDYIENSEASYKRVGNLVSDGRLAGLIDWDAIEDRTRSLASLSFWSSPNLILRDAAHSYRRNLWQNQPFYCEVWVEKEALAGVVARACDRWRVPYFSCRGYVSQSEMYSAAQRLAAQANKPGGLRLIHLGDHDPSGIDMSRDIADRLQLMMGEQFAAVDFQRIALNYDQVQAYNPPPNPAKQTDSRFAEYQRQFGEVSWELDALEPSVLVEMIEAAIETGLDPKAWELDRAREAGEANTILAMARDYSALVEYLTRGGEATG